MHQWPFLMSPVQDTAKSPKVSMAARLGCVSWAFPPVYRSSWAVRSVSKHESVVNADDYECHLACHPSQRSPQRGVQPDRPPSAVVGRNDPRPRYANIAIIEGNGANQYGIGMVSARIAEIMLRDERAVIPIGYYNQAYGVTLSLPAIVGRRGVIRVLEPAMSADECPALQPSADTLRSVLAHVVGAMGSGGQMPRSSS